jgi:hypothetical protein
MYSMCLLSLFVMPFQFSEEVGNELCFALVESPANGVVCKTTPPASLVVERVRPWPWSRRPSLGRLCMWLRVCVCRRVSVVWLVALSCLVPCSVWLRSLFCPPPTSIIIRIVSV